MRQKNSKDRECQAITEIYLVILLSLRQKNFLKQSLNRNVAFNKQHNFYLWAFFSKWNATACLQCHQNQKRECPLFIFTLIELNSYHKSIINIPIICHTIIWKGIIQKCIWSQILNNDHISWHISDHVNRVPWYS